METFMLDTGEPHTEAREATSATGDDHPAARPDATDRQPGAVLSSAQGLRSASKRVEALRKKEANRIRELKLPRPDLRPRAGPGITEIRAKLRKATADHELARQVHDAQTQREAEDVRKEALRRAPTAGQRVKIATAKLEALKKRALRDVQPEITDGGNQDLEAQDRWGFRQIDAKRRITAAAKDLESAEAAAAESEMGPAATQRMELSSLSW